MIVFPQTPGPLLQILPSPALRLQDIINDVSDEEETDIEPQHPSLPGETSNYIRYDFTKSRALSNSWEDPQYLATSFPTLFPTGLGGHLDERTVKVSLEAFGKWALSHSRR